MPVLLVDAYSARQLFGISWSQRGAEDLAPIPQEPQIVRVPLGAISRPEMLVGGGVLGCEEGVQPAQASNKPTLQGSILLWLDKEEGWFSTSATCFVASC